MTDIITDVIAELESLRGMQYFETTTDPSASLAQVYKFKLTLDGATFNSGNDISVTLTATESLSSIATKIAAAINAITASSVTAAVDATSGKILVKSVSSTSLTSQVSLSAGSSASLLTLLGGVGPSIAKPSLTNANLVNASKVFPNISITDTWENYAIATVNMSGQIKTNDFGLRIYVPAQTTKALTQAYSDQLLSECRRIIDGKQMAGGWWHLMSIFPERGNLIDVPYCLCKQTLFVTTPGRA